MRYLVTIERDGVKMYWSMAGEWTSDVNFATLFESELSANIVAICQWADVEVYNAPPTS